VGTLEEDEIILAIRKSNMSSEIGQHLHPAEVVSVDDSLLKVYHLIRQQGFGIIGVMDENKLIGVVDEGGLTNFVRLEARNG
jgi:predicted transcriptional regulator